MTKIILKTISPLFGLFLFVLGQALFITLAGLRLNHDGYSTAIIGLMGFVTNFGYLIGAFRSERFILRVGHIRAFAAFSSAIAASYMLQGLIVNIWLWIPLRFIAGVGISGVFIVIESWLLAEGTQKTRGQVLAIYMVSLYAAQAFGQMLLHLGSVEDLTLFAVASMLASLAVIPLAMTKAPTPQFTEPSTLSIKKMVKLSPNGIIGCVGAGMILSAVYSLMPVYIVEHLSTDEWVAFFMAVIIFGGMMLQFPVGKASDLISRKKVLFFLSLATIAIALFNIVSFTTGFVTYLAFFLLGGITFTLYPVSISLASDTLEFKDLIAGTQVLLLSYSLGAMIGPLAAPVFMSTLGLDGLFVYFAIVASLMSVLFLFIKEHPSEAAQEEYFVPIVQTTPVTAELDPRTKEPDIIEDVDKLPS